MRALLDTNVLLDVLLGRSPWVTESAAVWHAHDAGRIVGYITACAVADIFYIARRLSDLETARQAIHVCLEAFQVCAVDIRALQQAETLPGSDFEDNLQIACSALAGLDAIVTRDKAGFEGAPMSVLTPAELLAQMGR